MEIDSGLLSLPNDIMNANNIKAMVLGRLVTDKVITDKI